MLNKISGNLIKFKNIIKLDLEKRQINNINYKEFTLQKTINCSDKIQIYYYYYSVKFNSTLQPK